LSSGVTRKTENLFRFGFLKKRLKTEPSKNLKFVEKVSRRNCVQSAIQIKSDKK